MPKKFRLFQLRKQVDEIQNKLRKESNYFNPKNPLDGHCIRNEDFGDLPGGRAYRSNEQSQHGPYGHSVGVVATKGSRKGKVVDITQEEGIVGETPNIEDDKGTRESLSEIFGFSGWGRRK